MSASVSSHRRSGLPAATLASVRRPGGVAAAGLVEAGSEGAITVTVTGGGSGAGEDGGGGERLAWCETSHVPVTGAGRLISWRPLHSGLV